MASPRVASTTSTARPDELDELLCFDLYAASHAMTALYRPVLTELGLTYPQYLVLVVLAGRGEATIKELAGALRLDHATMAPLLRRMQEAGLVSRRRSADDERAVVVTLEPPGAEASAHFEDIACAVRDATGLSRRGVRELQVTLRSMTDAVSRGPGGVPGSQALR